MTWKPTVSSDEIWVPLREGHFSTGTVDGKIPVSLKHRASRIWPELIVAPRLHRVEVGVRTLRRRLQNAWWALRHEDVDW